MANTLNNTLDKIGNVVESIMSATKKATQYEGSNRVYMGQTCLERFGIVARNSSLMRNEWKKDLQYTKPLVDAEYMVQTEFKVSSYEDRLKEQQERILEKNAEKQNKKIQKEKDKQARKAEREKKKEEKSNPKIEVTEPKETLYRDIYTQNQAKSAMDYMRQQKLNLT